MQSGNQSQTNEQIRQKNMIENKKNNSILKIQLKEISSQIEQVLYLQGSKKNEVNVEDSSTKIDIQTYTHFQSAIDRYKKSIESMKKEISLNQYENVINNENDYKKNIQYLKKLEKENEYLTKITKELKDQLSETNGTLEVNGNQKLRELDHLKQEIKLINDSNKNMKQTIKEQNKMINILDLEVKKIKSNIDFAKAQQEKINNMNNAKENKNEKAEINLEDLSENEIIEEIKKYQDSIKKLNIEIKEQEKNYNDGIKKQKKEKSKIDSDLKILNIKIKQMKKGNKIRELKLKEMKKIQEIEQKNKLKLEQEKRKKEEKRKREIYKNKKYLEFQKKIRELGLNGDNEDNAADERYNYYNHTSMDNYNYNNNNNFAPKSQIMPNTAKNKNYGNFSSYSNRNAPFSIKFKTNNNRVYTQGQNDQEKENEIEYENYNDEFENENENDNNKESNNNGRVINEIDDLKNDIMNALNKDDDNNFDDKIENIKMNKQKANNEKDEKENDGIDENIDDGNNDINNNGNLNGNNNNKKVSGNRNPFNISPFNNS